MSDHFEQLTLADVVVQWLRAPRRTWDQFTAIARQPRESNITESSIMEEVFVAPPRPKMPSREASRPVPQVHEMADDDAEDAIGEIWLNTADNVTREALILGVRLVAFLLAIAGNALAVAPRGEISPATMPGIGMLSLALVMWLGVEIYAHLPAWRTRDEAGPDAKDPEPQTFAFEWDGFPTLRFVLAGLGFAAAVVGVAFTWGNQFTLAGFVGWMLSIIFFSAAVASDDALYGHLDLRWRPRRFLRSGTFLTLVVIVILGASLRLTNLVITPPQMTSDHVEKLLDAQRVLDGERQIFFPNNGGREPFQMYAMAVMSQIPSLRMDFFGLKLLTVIEGLVTLPFLWWMGRVVVGEENRRLGNVVGLVLAALVAVSHWHLGLSRMGLRIVLTPLVTALLVIFLARGMRHNHRDDYLRAGLVLGFGLYAYQAVRMLPVVVIIGVLIAVVMRVRTWASFRQYALNFATLVFMSFVVFLPLFSYSLQAPEHFWMRTSGRLLGDSLIREEDEDGDLVMRDSTVSESLEALQTNLPVFGNNFRRALLMFNWQGDGAWINNTPNVPQMDVTAGALFLLGVVSWAVYLARTRDPVAWLIPLALLTMLLPSALALAYPIENPSATRASGTLPFAYLLAALPLAVIMQSVWRLSTQRWVALSVSGVMVSLVIAASYLQSANIYLNRYHDSYLLSSLPYREAGDDLEAFNTLTDTDGGNAFMIAFPYWWDHRALGIEGGMIDWPNGIVALEDVPQFLFDGWQRVDQYQIDPEKDLLFFHAAEDDVTPQMLADWFPTGRRETIFVEAHDRSYAIYRVPALGRDQFAQFLIETIPDLAAD